MNPRNTIIHEMAPGWVKHSLHSKHLTLILPTYTQITMQNHPSFSLPHTREKLLSLFQNNKSLNIVHQNQPAYINIYVTYLCYKHAHSYTH